MSTKQTSWETNTSWSENKELQLCYKYRSRLNPFVFIPLQYRKKRKQFCIYTTPISQKQTILHLYHSNSVKKQNNSALKPLQYRKQDLHLSHSNILKEKKMH